MAIYEFKPVFSRGEISRRLWSRADLDLFKMGLRYCQNWVVMRQGGLRRRGGTQFIGEVKDSTRPARFIPFIFSANQAYMLVFNAGVFRVYTLGGRVGTVEVAHPYADADLFQLDFDQTNDVLDITHKAYQPRRVKRQSDTSWSIDTVPARDGPYLPVNATATTMTPSDTGNAIPVMTSNTTPSGVCSASSSGGGTSPYLAFDGDSTTFWAASSSTKSGWLAYQFPSAKVIVGYTVQASDRIDVNDPNNSGSLNAPKSWSFEGSNDGSTWIVLDSQFGQTAWSNSEARSFLFENTTSFLYYRVNIVSNDGGSFLNVAALRMLELPANATAIPLTASAIVGINNDAGFMANDVGRFITLLGSDAVYHPFQIVGITSSTVVTVKATGNVMPIARGTLQWRFGAWGETPGWPAHVCTFEGRKTYARTNAQPSGLWGTKSLGYGTFLDFSVSVPIKDDDSISFLLTDANEIQWIAEAKEMQIGTAGYCRTMGRDSLNLPFSATNFRQTLVSTYASQAIRPVKVGNSTIFVSSYGKALREFGTDDGGASYQTPDISVLSEHLFASGIIELAFSQEPDSVIWVPNGNGDLIGMTYEKAQSMAAFHRHTMGGGGFVESAANIPGTGRDEPWIIVRRTIGGVTKRYIERMAPTFDENNTLPANAWHVDCGLQYNGSPVTTVSGLSHLEGLTVSILADGAREADQVVTGGSVSLDSGQAASNIIVGLPFQSYARTLPSPTSSGDGSGMGRRKKIVKCIVDLLAAGPVKIGRNLNVLETLNYRATTDNLGSPPGLTSGFVEAHPETSWSDGGTLDIVVDGPQTAAVRSLTIALEPEP